MNFRYVPVESNSAAMNMAIDETILEGIQAGTSQPTIRLYRWKPSAVSIGYFQCLTDEVDVEATKKDRVDVVRRLTGGGAVYHDETGEITYSILAPTNLFANDIVKSYEQLCNILIAGLKNVGVEATFRPINDLLVNKKKISGNAQTRKGGVLLQHGTILVNVDAKKMFRYLTPDKAKMSDKPYIKSVESAVTSLSEQTNASREKVEASLRKAFMQVYPGKAGGYTEEEQIRAQELAEKYVDEAWIAMR